MLDSHNTTIVTVTWLEKLHTFNHTGKPLENLNMTNGRLLTLHDNGLIRTALGQTTMMGQILESFNEFKGTGGAPNRLMLSKRDTMEVDWMSFNTFGENMAEGYEYLGDLYENEDLIRDYGQSAASFDDAFVQDYTGNYLSKFCLSAGPNGDAVAQDSIIVGEVYMNAWGGIDSNCDSG